MSLKTINKIRSDYSFLNFQLTHLTKGVGLVANKDPSSGGDYIDDISDPNNNTPTKLPVFHSKQSADSKVSLKTLKLGFLI